MSPKERLKRYFNLSHRQSQLSVDEYHEMLHLEEALIDDIDRLDLPDTLYELQWAFIRASMELLCGPYAVLDTGSSWDVMSVLLESALPKLSPSDRIKIADMVGGRIACGCYPSRKEFIKQLKKSIK